MKSYTVTFSYMIETESAEDAVQQTVADLIYAVRHGNMIPLTVQEENEQPMLVEVLINKDGTIASLPLKGEAT